MLSDPLSITYNSVGKSLPATGSFEPAVGRLINSRRYATSDSQFEVFTSSWINGDVVRTEITLRRTTPDPDSDPFTGNTPALPNSVGLVFEANTLRYATSVDIPLLRTALLALVDSTLQGRLIAGEL